MLGRLLATVPEAERLTLEAPIGVSLEALASATPAVADALEDRAVRAGDVVEVDGIALVACGAEPGFPSRVRARTAIDLVPAKPPVDDLFDVSILLDASRSMRKDDVEPTRIDACAEAVRDFATAASDVVARLEIAPFQSRSYPLMPIGPLDQAPLADLSLLNARGGGDLERALDETLARLASERPGRRRAAVIVVTDGDAYEYPLPDQADRARALGVTLYALVVGGDEAPGLRAAAEATGGVYVEAGPELDVPVTLRPFLGHLAAQVGVPVEVAPPPERGTAGPQNFEMVLRASPSEGPGGLAARIRRHAEDEP